MSLLLGPFALNTDIVYQQPALLGLWAAQNAVRPTVLDVVRIDYDTNPILDSGPPSGVGAGVFPLFTGAATGTQTTVFTATSAGVFPVFVGAAVGIKSYVGTGAGTFPVFVGSATGTKSYSGTAAGTFPKFNGAATGTQTHAATAAGTFPAFTGTATGTHTAGATGTGAGTFPAFTGAANGTHTAVAGDAGGWEQSRQLAERLRRRQLPRERWRELETVQSAGTAIVLRLVSTGGGTEVPPLVDQEEEDLMFILGLPVGSA